MRKTEESLLAWNNQNRDWEMYFTAQNDACNSYAHCGAYGNCDNTGCLCLKGFEPKNVVNWLDGCVRKSQLRRDSSDSFTKFTGIRLPDTQHALFNLNKDLGYSQAECLLNCTCTAYAYMDVTEGGTGCLLWFDELIDIVLDSSWRCILKRVGIAAGAVFLTAALLLGSFLIHVFKKRKGNVAEILIAYLTLLTAK